MSLSSQTRRHSRPAFIVQDPKPESPPPEGCICVRKKTTVFCKSCGWVCDGARVRTICPLHLRTLYLLDIGQCPICKSYPPILSELKSSECD